MSDTVSPEGEELDPARWAADPETLVPIGKVKRTENLNSPEQERINAEHRQALEEEDEP